MKRKLIDRRSLTSMSLTRRIWCYNLGLKYPRSSVCYGLVTSLWHYWGGGWRHLYFTGTHPWRGYGDLSFSHRCFLATVRWAALFCCVSPPPPLSPPPPPLPPPAPQVILPHKGPGQGLCLWTAASKPINLNQSFFFLVGHLGYFSQELAAA